jgi:hypothetical protein
MRDVTSLASPVFFGWVRRTASVTSMAAPSSVSFTVAYDRPDYVAVPDTNNAGVILTGANAVKRVVALSLSSGLDPLSLPSLAPLQITNQKVFDPTMVSLMAGANRLNPNQIMESSSATFWDSAKTLSQNITALEAQITVVQL